MKIIWQRLIQRQLLWHRMFDVTLGLRGKSESVYGGTMCRVSLCMQCLVRRHLDACTESQSCVTGRQGEGRSSRRHV